MPEYTIGEHVTYDGKVEAIVACIGWDESGEPRYGLRLPGCTFRVEGSDVDLRTDTVSINQVPPSRIAKREQPQAEPDTSGKRYCTKEEFEAFIANYPRPEHLYNSVVTICDPPMQEVTDRSMGEAGRMVAGIHLMSDREVAGKRYEDRYWIDAEMAGEVLGETVPGTQPYGTGDTAI
jgi:hypothetical protein